MALEDKIRKAAIPAAGKGTRLAPLTRAMPKELIRVGKKAVIGHILDMLNEGGISDSLIITGWKKGPLLDYIGSGKDFNMNVYYTIQEEQKGTGHALMHAKSWINGEDFVFVYGDNYIRPYSVLNDLIEFHKQKESKATLLLHPVVDPRRFGIVKLDENGIAAGMIEKPNYEEAEQYLTNGEYLNIAGMGILSSDIFEYIQKTKPGKNNEMQLTDSIELMRKDGKLVCGYIFRGKRFDIGTQESLDEVDKLHVKYLKELETTKGI